MKEITVEQLQTLMHNQTDFQLIDVREPYEFETCNLGGELIPLGNIPAQVDKISKNKKVVVYCRTGQRSFKVGQWLEKNHNFKNVCSLKGGILAWSDKIDPNLCEND